MLVWSVKQDQGGRKYQEDRYDVVTSFERVDAQKTTKKQQSKVELVAVAAVYDGHGNASVSTALAHKTYGLATTLSNWRAKHGHFPLKNDASEVFHDMDRNLWHLLRSQAKRAGAEATAGSTAVVAAIEADRVVLYNVGDSRAVVVDAESGDIIVETNDHKPSRVDERARIMARGGVVSDTKDVARAASRYSKFGYSTSRAFGDFELKKDFNERLISEESASKSSDRKTPTADHRAKDVALAAAASVAHPVHDGVMSATPEVHEGRVDLARRYFVVLASDGLWDEIDSREIGDWIRAQQKSVVGEKQHECIDAADLSDWMLETAKERGSDDNMTVLIVELGELNDGACLERMERSVVGALERLERLASVLEL